MGDWRAEGISEGRGSGMAKWGEGPRRWEGMRSVLRHRDGEGSCDKGEAGGIVRDGCGAPRAEGDVGCCGATRVAYRRWRRALRVGWRAEKVSPGKTWETAQCGDGTGSGVPPSAFRWQWVATSRRLPGVHAGAGWPRPPRTV